MINESMLVPEFLSHQSVADLYWVCHAPQLMQDLSCCDFPIPEISWFKALQLNPQALELHLQQRNLYLLGTYFEALWEFLLEHGPYTDLLAKNIQVFSGQGSDRKTLGEMDFIYFCLRRQKTVHLEVAVKFYIACHLLPPKRPVNVLPLSYWIGPQCNDRLDIKYTKLRDKQSRLASCVEGIAALKAKNIRVELAEVSMPGFLFSQNISESAAISINTAHLHGVHYSLQAFIDAELMHSHWRVLAKPFWLSVAGVTATDSADFLCWAKLILYLNNHFDQSDRAVMLASLNEIDGKTLPSRFFITANHWPKHTAVTAHLF
ncbi:MAG: DUF1853 family protein [Pseudomonadales bacterium]|nr:DUF1853 family protein [Pseudomonadales bacterium]